MASQEQQVVEREQSRFDSTSNSPSKADQLLREAFIRKWQPVCDCSPWLCLIQRLCRRWTVPPLFVATTARVFVTLLDRNRAPLHLSYRVSLVLMSSSDVLCATMEHLFIVRRCAWPRACLTFLEQGLVLLIWFKILIEPALASVYGTLALTYTVRCYLQ